MAAAAVDCEPSLQNIIERTSLRWVFVGGKGGVGKTTVSCSLALQLSRVRDKVLLVSTDPAHSLTDAWGQTFTNTPQLVDGFSNLYAMETDINGRGAKFKMPENPTEMDYLVEMLTPELILEGFPGIDEFIASGMLWRLIGSLEYSVVVFDMAPTGHALKFIGIPFLFEKLMGRFTHVFQLFRLLESTQMPRLLGIQPGAVDTDPFKELKEVPNRLRDPAKTSFVGVCIAEFLSLYETERLIQRLTMLGVHTHNLVVNQLHFPFTEEADDDPREFSCPLCSSRRQMQHRYLQQIKSLYQDIHVTRLPLLEGEVRGVDMLEPFSLHLLQPYTLPHPKTAAQ